MSEDGNVVLELTLGVAVLVIPVVTMVAMLPVWLEQRAVAALAAREAARAFVLADEPGEAAQAARSVATRIASDHGLDERTFSIRVSGRLVRGGAVVAFTRVHVPAVRVPGLGSLGGFTISTEHREVVDPYRSW